MFHFIEIFGTFSTQLKHKTNKIHKTTDVTTVVKIICVIVIVDTSPLAYKSEAFLFYALSYKISKIYTIFQGHVVNGPSMALSVEEACCLAYSKFSFLWSPHISR